MNAAALARKAKERHPEFYCAEKNCLWRTVVFRGGYPHDPEHKPCPKHMKSEVSPSTPGAA